MRNLFVNLLTTSFSYGEERHFVKIPIMRKINHILKKYSYENDNYKRS